MRQQSINLLLVEDDKVDARLIQRAFKGQPFIKQLVIVPDGIEALAVLRGERMLFEAPYLILLDLNLPRMSGTEFLQFLRVDPDLRRSIVFVLTTSKAERDKAETYGYQVAGYIAKSEAGDLFTDIVTLLQHYSQLVEFP